MEVEKLFAIDIFGTDDREISVEVQSGKDGETPCITQSFTTSGEETIYYSKGHTQINANEILGNCFRYLIRDHKAKVRIMSRQNQYLRIGKKLS